MKSTILLAIVMLSFAGTAQAKTYTYNEKAGATMTCAGEWLREARGVSQINSTNLSVMQNSFVGGPEMPLFVANMSNCLGRMGFKVFSTGRILNMGAGGSVAALAADFMESIK